MAYTYLALAIFAFIAIFVPVSMLLIAKLLGARPKQNSVKLESYESAEEPIGTHRDITSDYLHYFPLYLGFELVVVVLIAWAMVEGHVGSVAGYSMLFIVGAAFVLSGLGIAIAHLRQEGLYGRETVY